MGTESNRRPSLRVWSELVPHDELVRPRPLTLLRRYGLALALAVRPADLPGLPRVLGTLVDAGVHVALWPMLDDDEGRWASAANVAPFLAFTEKVVDGAAALQDAPFELVFDVEPPIGEGRALLSSWVDSWSATIRAPAQLREFARRSATLVPDAERRYRAAIRSFKERGLVVSAALLPSALAGGDRAEAWERRIGVPHLADAWDHVSVMLYTTLIEGWSRAMMRRSDALTVLHHAAKSTVRRFGERAGVSLGTVGVGAFGTEPTYRAVSELAEDVSIARRAGIGRLDLFDFAGVLSRPPPEAWLEAFTSAGAATAPFESRATVRAKAALLFLRALGRGVARFG